MVMHLATMSDIVTCTHMSLPLLWLECLVSYLLAYDVRRSEARDLDVEKRARAKVVTCFTTSVQGQCMISIQHLVQRAPKRASAPNFRQCDIQLYSLTSQLRAGLAERLTKQRSNFFSQ